jgi:hypothetical protein
MSYKRCSRGTPGVFLIAIAAALAGCTAQPTVIPTPEIAWKEGLEPSSPLESDPRIVAFRQAMVGRALAWNTGDFTIRQYTEYASEEMVAGDAKKYATQGDQAFAYKGPQPFQPLEIEEGPGWWDAISICAYPFKDWALTSPSFVWSELDLPYPTIHRWYVGKSEDGSWRLLGGGGTNARCDGSTIPIGYFNPQPKLPDGPITKPKRAPLD